MHLVDTHCHIHQSDYELDSDEVISAAAKAGVTKMLCVGTSAQDSEQAVNFVRDRSNCWASIGHHPHEADDFDDESKRLMRTLIGDGKIVAIGECGLDYFYMNSNKDAQERAFRWQLDLASDNNLPMIFHVRGSKEQPNDAFEDLWKILDDYQNLEGVVHSFTANEAIAEEIVERGFYAGINGIMTFSKDERQLAALDTLPIGKIVLETDAPFLTPTPYRGIVNQPKHIVEVAKFVSERKGIALTEVAKTTSQNAVNLFKI